MKRERRFGFTLVEMLVIISIMMLFSSLVLASVAEQRARARDSQRITDLQGFELALEQYYDEFRAYPCGTFPDSANNTGPKDSWHMSPVSCYDMGFGQWPGFLDGHANFFSQYGVPDACDTSTGAPESGIYTQGFYFNQCPHAPTEELISGLIYGPVYTGYGYHVSSDRQRYLLLAGLERDDEKMANDSGFCADAYEVGNGVGFLRPHPGFNGTSGSGC